MALDYDLAQGSRGDSVRAIHEYLTKFGYFPNDELARTYPSWRPIVPHPPADPDVYDENTTHAVRAFQANEGLAPTGIVDQPTRGLMTTARCGVPDGMPHLDPSDKFAVLFKTFDHPITWAVYFGTGWTPPGISAAQVVTAAQSAVATWGAQMNLPMTYTGGQPCDVTIAFNDIDGPGGYLAQTEMTQSPNSFWGELMTLDSAETWSLSGGAGRDLQSVITHEFGHALGLDHSSFPNASMYPSYTGTKRVLDIDDKVAISTQYDVWVVATPALPVAAIDIGVGLDSWPWVVASNNTIWRFVGSGWTQDQSGGIGKRIAGGRDGRPWLVDLNGNIWRYSTNDPLTGHWDFQPGGGCAIDIGVGGDFPGSVADGSGSVWIIGCGGSPDGGIFRFNGSSWDYDQSGGRAALIAVGPTGVPWVITSSAAIFRYSTNNPSTGSWGVPLAGAAFDIGVSPTAMNSNNYAWVIGTLLQANNDFSIHALEEQPPVPGAPGKGEWLQVLGGARHIAVGPKGEPWIVNNGGTVFSTPK